MRSSYFRPIYLSAGLLLVGILAGCHTHKPTMGSDLSMAAWQTHANYVRSSEAAQGGDIPPKYWTAPIKALKPIRVYTHMVNVVVVQRITGGTEEGKYIYIPISSQLPTNGLDGFILTPDPQKDDAHLTGMDVFDFKREIKK